ncbi:hypothetical protein D3C80_127970 [compost metagenome]
MVIKQAARIWRLMLARRSTSKRLVSLSLLLLLSGNPAIAAQGNAPVLPNGNEMPTVSPEGTVTASGIKQIPGFWEGPGQDDLMVRMLQMSMGDPVTKASRYLSNPLPGAEGDVTSMTVMAEVIAVAPSLAWVVGGILAVYFIFGGLLNSGRDGEFLGQKWDSWFTPLRSGLSIAGIYPAPGFGGIANIQVLVITLSLLGIGMGSALWYYSAEKMVSTPVMIPQPAAVGSLASDTLKAQVCAAIENKNLTGQATVPPASETTKPVSGGYQSAAIVSSRVDSIIKIGSCGSVAFSGVSTGQSPSYSLLSDSTSVFDNVMQHMGTAQRSAYLALYASLADIAKVMVDDQKTLDEKMAMANKYAAAVNSYNNTVLQSAQNAVQNDKIKNATNELLRNVKKLGFAMAGSFFYVLQAHQDQVYGAVEQSRPTISLTTERFLTTKAATMDGAMNEFSRSILALNKMLGDYAMYQSPQDSIDRVKEVASENSGEWQISQMASSISRYLAEAVANNAGTMFTDNSNDMPDPLMEIKHIGNRLQAAYLAGAIAMATLGQKNGESGVLQSLVSKIPFVGGVVTTVLDTIFGSILPFIFLFGFLLSNIVPAIPFIMYSMAIMGYLIYLYESYFAAPFWISMHGTPEGHSITGQGASGYPILLTLVLRPSLIVVGLVFAMTIVRIMGWFLKQTVFGTVEIINVGGFNITSVLGQLAVYAALMAAIISKSYALTYELPNAILKWMGVGTHHADLGEGEGQRSTMMVAGRLTQGMNRLTRPDAPSPSPAPNTPPNRTHSTPPPIT